MHGCVHIVESLQKSAGNREHARGVRTSVIRVSCSRIMFIRLVNHSWSCDKRQQSFFKEDPHSHTMAASNFCIPLYTLTMSESRSDSSDRCKDAARSP